LLVRLSHLQAWTECSLICVLKRVGLIAFRANLLTLPGRSFLPHSLAASIGSVWLEAIIIATHGRRLSPFLCRVLHTHRRGGGVQEAEHRQRVLQCVLMLIKFMLSCLMMLTALLPLPLPLPLPLLLLLLLVPCQNSVDHVHIMGGVGMKNGLR